MNPHITITISRHDVYENVPLTSVIGKATTGFLPPVSFPVVLWDLVRIWEKKPLRETRMRR
jgi:hypothetical protein